MYTPPLFHPTVFGLEKPYINTNLKDLSIFLFTAFSL